MILVHLVTHGHIPCSLFLYIRERWAYMTLTFDHESWKLMATHRLVCSVPVQAWVCPPKDKFFSNFLATFFSRHWAMGNVQILSLYRLLYLAFFFLGVTILLHIPPLTSIWGPFALWWGPLTPVGSPVGGSQVVCTGSDHCLPRTVQLLLLLLLLLFSLHRAECRPWGSRSGLYSSALQQMRLMSCWNCCTVLYLWRSIFVIIVDRSIGFCIIS